MSSPASIGLEPGWASTIAMLKAQLKIQMGPQCGVPVTKFDMQFFCLQQQRSMEMITNFSEDRVNICLINTVFIIYLIAKRVKLSILLVWPSRDMQFS